MSVTLGEYLEEQRRLELEAASAFAGKIEDCTYEQGYLQQPIWVCLEHEVPVALCYACSVECHRECERMVDIGMRRHFRCDCGGPRVGHEPCRLKIGFQGENCENRYEGAPFTGHFCHCKSIETGGVMHQCVGCEDWFHADCLFGGDSLEIDGSALVCPGCRPLFERLPHLQAKGTVGECLLLPSDWQACDCEACAPLLKPLHLLSQDPIYTPEPDPEAEHSLYERGLQALQQKAPTPLLTEALQGINQIKQALSEYLRQLNKSEVTEADMHAFVQANKHLFVPSHNLRPTPLRK